MSRWWRAYDEAVDDPKLILLTDHQHRAWFNLCCIASQSGGALPTVAVIAVKLRVKPDRAKHVVAEMVALGLVDHNGGKFEMHNWSGRQFKNDTDTTAAERSRNYRDRKRGVTRGAPVTDRDANASVTRDCHDQSQKEQITETESKKEPPLRGANVVPIDFRAELFGRGLKLIAELTGKTPDSCRSLLGKWLKTSQDEAVHVLGALDDAKQNRIADPVAWINQRLAQQFGGSRARQNDPKSALGALRKIQLGMDIDQDWNAPLGLPSR